MRNARFVAAAALLASCIEGPEGPPGQKGATGPAGPSGPRAASEMAASAYSVAGSPAFTPYRPAYWFSCSAALDLIGQTGALGSDGIKETQLGYVVTLFSNYDVSTSCIASIGTAQDGSGSQYYPSSTVGAAHGNCIASSDYPPLDGNAGFWQYSLPVDPGPMATYNDAPSLLDNKSYVFAESDCTVMRLGRDAVWMDVSLASLLQ